MNAKGNDLKDKLNFSYLRHDRATDLQELFERVEWLPENLEVQMCKGGIIFPYQNTDIPFAGVIDENGMLAEKSRFNPEDAEVIPDCRDVPFIDKRVVYLGHLNTVWGHFLLDCSIRFWYILQETEPADAYVFACKEGETPPIEGNEKELLELLGIANKIILVSEPARFREVIIPAPSLQKLFFARKVFLSPQYYHTFSEIRKKVELECPMDSKPDTPVFLSSSAFGSKKKKEIGQDFLDHFFQKNGFTILHPEAISLRQLIQHFSHAPVIASEAGSVADNILFASPDCEQIVIHKNSWNDIGHVAIDSARKGKVTYIDGHYMVYPVSIGNGPFLLGYTSWFSRFVEEQGYLPPDECFTEDSYVKACFKEYQKKYRMQWGLRLGNLHTKEASTFFSYPLFLEAYRDSYSRLYKWMDPKGLYKQRLKVKLNSYKHMQIKKR